jgi:uncharacterized protein (TIGR03435 family)
MPASQERLRLMLRTLIADRIQLTFHREPKNLRVYALIADKSGPKIHAASNGDAGPHTFRGDLQQFANLLSNQLTIPAIEDPTRPSIASGPPIPVPDLTGLAGVYDIPWDRQPDATGDGVSLLQRILRDHLGLGLERRKANVEFLVVDHAERAPSAIVEDRFAGDALVQDEWIDSRPQRAPPGPRGPILELSHDNSTRPDFRASSRRLLP